MSSAFFQYLVTGLTIGTIYAMIALGASIVYNASHAINFAQGEFVMVGGLAAAVFTESGMPLLPAVAAGLGLALLTGAVVAFFAERTNRFGSIEAVIIMTIGAATLIRGTAEVVWGRGTHRLDAFSGETPFHFGGVSIMPQSLWVLGVTLVMFVILVVFFRGTLLGKAMIATSHNALAAQLVGVDVKRVVVGSYLLAAGIGAVAGIVVAPITLAYSEMGLPLGLKGFSAAILGGLGSGPGAVTGGMVLGLVEAFGAGYVSSAYKDAIAYLLIIVALIFFPAGLVGSASEERV